MSVGIKATGYLKQMLAHDEEVEMIVHQHVLVLLGKTILPLVLALAIIGGVTILREQLIPDLGSTMVAYGYALAVLPLLLIFWRYIAWRNHSYVMTSRRVIQIKGVFDKEVADSVLDKLNDVKTDQRNRK